MIHKIVLFGVGTGLDVMGFLELVTPTFNSIAPTWEWGVLFLSVGILLNFVGIVF